MAERLSAEKILTDMVGLSGSRRWFSPSCWGDGVLPAKHLADMADQEPPHVVAKWKLICHVGHAVSKGDGYCGPSRRRACVECGASEKHELYILFRLADTYSPGPRAR